MESLFTIDEAAKALRISRFTVECWLSRGKLLRTKCGDRTLIRESELERMLIDGGKSPAPRRKAGAR